MDTRMLLERALRPQFARPRQSQCSDRHQGGGRDREFGRRVPSTLHSTVVLLSCITVVAVVYWYNYSKSVVTRTRDRDDCEV